MDLIDLVKKSDSNELVKNISKTMDGNTFHHHYHILYDIRTLLGTDKKIYTEIGTYCGGSLLLMCSHNYITEINSIDPLNARSNQRKILENNISKFNKNNYNINIYQKYSNDSNFINELKIKKFKTDILFIDGDHSYMGVINDFNNFCEFVNPNGYIIFDDYLDYKYSPEVKKAVDDIISKLDNTKYNIIGLLPNLHNSYGNGVDLQFLNEFIIQKL